MNVLKRPGNTEPYQTHNEAKKKLFFEDIHIKFFNYKGS
jgi:hypothetical protein